MDEKKYLGFALNNLKFIGVVSGIEGFSADDDVSLNIKSNSNNTAIRNTTHCTLNSIASDHDADKFSESRLKRSNMTKQPNTSP